MSPFRVFLLSGAVFCLASCGESEFDLNLLPITNQGWSVSGGGWVFIEGSDDEEKLVVNQKLVEGEAAVLAAIEAAILSHDSSYPRPYFRLSGESGAEQAVTIIQGLALKFESPLITYFDTLLLEDSTREISGEIRTSTFILGEVHASLDKLPQGKSLEVAFLTIRESDYLLKTHSEAPEERVRTVKSIHEYLRTFLEIASISNCRPILVLNVEEGVTIQRFLSTLDFHEVKEVGLVFSE